MTDSNRDPIYVTKAFIPPLDEYQELVRGIFERGIFTNYGPLVKQLEKEVSEFLGVNDSIYVSNGTIALQLAIKVLGVKGEVITTPYSYVATASSILWEGCSPIFIDIDPDTFCLNAELIEGKITENTSAILATHVYGCPCDVEKIEYLAKKHGLVVIYDGAHAFGTVHKGKALLSYGDISTLSMHATKLFHTIEGGAIFTPHSELQEKLRLMRSFGHRGDDHISLGVNGKNSELHAAMGVCNLRYIDEILKRRKEQWLRYAGNLGDDGPRLLQIPKDTEFGYAYFPMTFEDEVQMDRVLEALKKKNVFPRRYFYPSLNTLPYLEHKDRCPVSERVANSVLCAPLYHTLENESIDMICDVILETVAN